MNQKVLKFVKFACFVSCFSVVIYLTCKDIKRYLDNNDTTVIEFQNLGKYSMEPDLEDSPYTEQEATQAQLGAANPKHGFGLCWAFSWIPRAILLLSNPYTVESGENHMTRMTAAPLKSQNLLQQLMMCFHFKICQVVFFFCLPYVDWLIWRSVRSHMNPH